ncbi:uncharacterized protein K452DRAFT_167254 [Aplosporella prunicola CBS 121167]|uniref:Uncharacterized protein n=1 Tax=Aplosporella prunicola CBS 121167 TaxID=1176127 RepID=A0A6A6BGR9_9PEZI|nr:uncharacterized protein K452DRAFT_167254 [Aplosporella prunicola CBS 121167]KAF2143176.1 hypothetical protein K452DRAFT_167254 [Aplosporella prunicola CBS 121167]
MPFGAYPDLGSPGARLVFSLTAWAWVQYPTDWRGRPDGPGAPGLTGRGVVLGKRVSAETGPWGGWGCLVWLFRERGGSRLC